jgi:hypothetical protein
MAHLNCGTGFTIALFLTFMAHCFKNLNYIVPSIYNNITNEDKKMAETNQAEA